MTAPLATVYVAWTAHHTEARPRYPVARLDRLVAESGPRMRLTYVRGVHEAIRAGFRPFEAMQALDRTWTTAGSFAFVRQRMMAPGRPEYMRWLKSMGLHPNERISTSTDPFRILVRSGGRNMADHLEFFAPVPLGDDRWRFEFFVRYLRGQSPEVTEPLERGTWPEGSLVLRPADVPGFPNALRIVLRTAETGADERTLGFVPAYYAPLLRGHLNSIHDITVLAVNPAPTEVSYRLLISCDVTFPRGWDFSTSQPALQPLPATVPADG